MKDPGDYALMHANGMSWAGVVAAIRQEVIDVHDANDLDDCQAMAAAEPQCGKCR